MKRCGIAVFIAAMAFVSALAAGEFEDLVKKAGEHYRAGEYRASGETFDLAFKAGEPGKNLYYTAACAWSLAGENGRALELLGKALDAGFLDRKILIEDTDLESLRGGDGWNEMMARLDGRIAAMEAAFPAELAVLESIDLPEPRRDGAVSVEKAMAERRSVRRYSPEPIAVADCSQLLWAAYGITLTREKMPDFVRGGLRTAPSAGARYPLEIYLVAWNVSGLPQGIYRYESNGHKLQKIAAGDFRDPLAAACLDQDWLKGAAVAIVYSAVFERNTAKYGERGRERYVCMDLGHSGENVYLQCGSLGMGTCAIGAFTDLDLKRVIGMTKAEEPLYVMPVGRIEAGNRQ
ncbi:MAG: SagB/ThcOx family dehydrogenase [Candidatus Krumholzibacteria bacterium]|jgi:SagB-type dehydrogenase family enzyme|nr:SagB/ThcOx family dehydrogenase [Candidatus Krumholzibacteria bacterium]